MYWKTILSEWAQRILVKCLLVMTLTFTFTLLPMYYQVIAANSRFAVLPTWLPDLPGWAWSVLPHTTPVLLTLAWLCWFKSDREANGVRRAQRRAELGLR